MDFTRTNLPGDHNTGNELIPMFGKNGTALSRKEREKLAQKKGICERCFAQKTYNVKSVFKKTPINSEHVHNGTCIRCYPDSVPQEVLAEWDARNRRSKPKPSVRTAAVSRPKKPKTPPPPSVNFIDNTPQVSVPTRSVSPLPDFSRAQSTPQPSFQSQHQYETHSSFDPPRSSSMEPNISTPISPARQPASYIEPSVDERKLPPLQIAPTPPPSTAEDYNPQGFETNAWDIIKSLRDNRDDPILVRKSLHRLRNLAMDDQTGALYEIKDIMQTYNDDPRTMAVACGALWGITALNDDMKEEAQTSGVMGSVIDGLRRPRDREDGIFVEWSCGTLACLSRGFENKLAIAEQGGIDYIIDAMKYHIDSAGVFEWGCRALHSVVHQYVNEGDDEYREEAAKAIAKNIITIDDVGGVVTIMKGMKTHSHEITTIGWAIRLLLRLLDRKDASSVKKILKKINDGDGVNSCVGVLKSRVTTRDLFASTVSLLASVIAQCPSDQTAMKSSLESIGPVIRAMKDNSDDEALQEACCSLLCVIVANGKDSRKVLNELEGCVAVASAMEEHITNTEIQESGCRLFWFMSTLPSFDFSGVDHALWAVAASTKAHPTSANIHAAACGIIANVSLYSSTEELNLPLDIPFETLSLKFPDELVNNQAFQAIINVANKDTSKFSNFMQGEKVTRLLQTMDNAPPSVQEALCGVLTAVASSSEESRKLMISSGCLDIAVTYLKNADSPSSANKALEVISALAVSEKSEKSLLKMPIDIFPSMVESMQTHFRTSELRQHGCIVIRNLLLGSVPKSTTLRLDGLMDEMIGLLESPRESVHLKKEACGVLWAMLAKQPDQPGKDIIKLFKCILNVMTLYKGEEEPYDSDLQSEAAGALVATTLCLQDTSYDLEDADIDLVIAVMYMVMEYDLTRLELLEKILEVILNLSMINQNTVIQCGGIVVVIDAMVEHETKEAIQERGCSILAVLSSAENLQVNLCIAETDGIDMIVSALAVFSRNERIQMDACKALSHLSVDRESRLLISSQGGLILVVNAMNNNRDNPALLEGSLSAMLNLSCDAEEQVLSDSNVVKTVVEVMRQHVDSRGVQEKGLGVLQNISMSNTDAKRLIGQVGGIAAVSIAVSEFMGSPNVLERAFTTLWSLAVLEQNQILIAENKGIPLVVNGMMANVNNVRVQKQACGCLCTLSSNSLNKKLIREAGGVDAIVFAMWCHYDSESLQVEACRSLSSLAVNVKTNEVMLASDGEITAIIAAMRRYPESSKLQEHACVALRNFMLSSDNAVLIKSNSEELRMLMTRAADRFPDRCSERAHQVLASLN